MDGSRFRTRPFLCACGHISQRRLVLYSFNIAFEPRRLTLVGTLSLAFGLAYGKAGDEIRTHDIHVGNVTLYH